MDDIIFLITLHIIYTKYIVLIVSIDHIVFFTQGSDRHLYIL